MNSFDLLKREIREYIFDQQWPSLTKIQEASIKYILETENNIVLSAPTASGKTEAAFLPTINSIEDWNDGLKIIYISPLVALINDQFKRIGELCNYLSINVTSWHGEASKSAKRKLLDNPNGIILITPESIEAMLCLRAGQAKRLFQRVEWILIDEIHGFLDNNRGIQLSSLMERLQKYIEKAPRYVAMSATLHNEDNQKVKEFFKNDKITNILVDKTRNKLNITKQYFKSNLKQQSDDAVDAIYNYSQEESMLVFPNNRGDVEYLSVSLMKKGRKNSSYTKYFAHHSSLTKELRILAENFAKNSVYELFTICCTSTLEMGIDIGSVDSIVQYNAPSSVTSLAQRLGRSGRKTKESILHFIATNPWDLLQGLAAISLYEEGVIDRLNDIQKPYDVLAHQIISMLLEKSSISLSQFWSINQDFLTWKSITNKEYKTLIQHLLENNYIEILEQEVIVGMEAEKLLKAGEFFSHFISENNFSVYEYSKKIGEIPLTPAICEGVNIFLAAQVWKIINIDIHGKKIFVSKAIDGNPPIFMSGVKNTSDEIRQRMKKILINCSSWCKYDENIQAALEEIRADNIELSEMHWVHTTVGVGFRSFAGSKINETLRIILDISYGNPAFYLDDKRTLLFSKDNSISIKSIVCKAKSIEWSEKYIFKYLELYHQYTERYINSVKYKDLLPLELQIKYIIENILDIKGALEFLKTLMI